MANKPALIVIIGPTASGKSALAVRLAKKFGGEIISADSRQVYRGLDIGTGKITQREMQGVPHHLLSVVSPKRQFSIAEFQRLAGKAIGDITRREKVTFLVGGTAFWIDALAYGMRFPTVPPNETLRKRLGKKSAPELFQILKRLDPARAKTIERQNPRRLIRAIEIAKAIGRTPKVKRQRPYRTFWIGLNPPKVILKKRIEIRTGRMLARGLVAETRSLIRARVPKSRIREFGFEYRAVLDHLAGKYTRSQLINAIVRASLDYARRQMTWWKRNKSIRWLKRPADAERHVRSFISPKTQKAREARKG